MSQLIRIGLLGMSLMASIVTGDDASDGTKVWAVVAYINHGERTPFIGGLQTVLTPEGAQQMWRQGTAFRNRYLTGNANSTQSTGAAPIQNISANALDNTQVTVVSQSNDWVAASAMAFMQGLYPPRTDVFVAAAGGDDLGRNVANGSTTTNYPLGGYQYPMIHTLSAQESSFVGLQGDAVCFTRQRELLNNLNNSKSIQDTVQQRRGFYQDLFSKAPLRGLLPLEQASYQNALDIYEFVDYMYTHNETVYDRLEDAQRTLETLQALAFTWERAKLNPPDGKADDSLQTLYSIAGRTLARQIARQALSSTGTQGLVGGKLSLFFGSMRPLLSFLSVGGLLTSNNTASGPLSHLPEPGAAIVFEIISSNRANTTSPFPELDDLQVRFYYKPSADAGETFSRYALFPSESDSGGGLAMPYRSFIREMRREGVTPLEWCEVCGAAGIVPWCTDAPAGDNANTGPTVAGAIGALVAACVIGLALMLCYMYRKFRAGRHEGGGGDDDALAAGAASKAGFRGDERRAVDADVCMTKGGAREARVGSWELRMGGRDDPLADDDTARIITKDFDRTSKRMEDGDGASIAGVPVKAREGF